MGRSARIEDKIADGLSQTDDEATIRFVTKAFPATIWPRLSEIARLRIENKFISSIKDVPATQRCVAGGLGIWSIHVMGQLTLKDDLVCSVSETPIGGHGERLRVHLLHALGTKQL